MSTPIPTPQAAQSALVALVKSCMAASGGSKAAVLAALNSLTDQIGGLVRRRLDSNGSTMSREPATTITLSRLLSSVPLRDVERMQTVPDGVIADLTERERTMFLALRRSVRSGRALAATLAAHRGTALDSPLGQRIAADRRTRH